MSFPSLAGAGGAECGPANPMANLMKQFQQDRSLQQDRMGDQRGESSKAPAFRTRGNRTMPMDRQFTEEFLRDAGPMERPHGAFEFGGLSRELEAIQKPHDNWAADFARQPHQMGPPDQHFEEFEKIYQQNRMAGPSVQPHQWHDDFASFQEQAHPSQHHLTQTERQAFERAFDQAKEGAQVNWDQEFAAQESTSIWANEFAEQEGITETPITTDGDKEALARTAGMLLDTVDADNNPKFKNSSFMSLMRSLRDRKVQIEGNKMVPTDQQGGDWAKEFGHGPSSSWSEDFAKQNNAAKGNMWTSEFATKQERGWAEDFTSNGIGATGSSSTATAGPMGYAPGVGMGMGIGAASMMSPRPMGGASTMMNNGSTATAQGDWAAQFDRHDQMQQEGQQKDMSEEEMQKVFGGGSDMEDWVQQYQQNIAHLKNSQDAEWDNMQKDWEQLAPQEEGMGYRAVNPEYDTYNFATDNPYLLDPSALDRVQHDTLADSIMALEAKAQLAASDASAWQELGFKQQENERDGAAIAALRRAVSMDPGLLDGWLALAVSYTNENCRLDAYDALEQWITNNEKYKHLVGSGKTPMQHNRHGYITSLFLDAARSSPGAEMDADVQVGLGILFNVSEEYAKAIDCFKAALQSRPQDYLLWNKLGATLANSRDPTGAIDAYFNALEINPSYVRARYNLAISCINLGQHREAAEHLLTALAIQQTADAQGASMMVDEQGNRIPVQGGMSDNVWDSLRMLMFMMNREDLAGQCDKRNLDIFRGEFDF
ncbi:hypothetical protein BDA99DRAFT_518754 [Phascolomyces articulosus]|uniref:Peroxisomal targeting signal receptor n=1 Tax=Phascolomyces articulosus TaxID=60185 RepID=A0AAD5PCV2_9FUNG|nr:hypothetical protein BDA99DRAFT_518754 [Phascolomyces articulosus]